MPWNIEYTDEFGVWWENISEPEQIDIAAVVDLLEKLGPQLKFPHTSAIRGTKATHIRELRIQHKGKPYRVLYAFDPRRTAILLIGGDKTGQNNWYEIFISLADKLYQTHLTEISDEVN